MKVVNAKWVDRIENIIQQGHNIDETISFNPAAQWLITKLSNLGIFI